MHTYLTLGRQQRRFRRIKEILVQVQRFGCEIVFELNRSDSTALDLRA